MRENGRQGAVIASKDKGGGAGAMAQGFVLRAPQIGLRCVQR
jgi:hypothetical protein